MKTVHSRELSESMRRKARERRRRCRDGEAQIQKTKARQQTALSPVQGLETEGEIRAMGRVCVWKEQSD